MSVVPRPRSRSLQSMGVEWSIDDFGTGYSSLSYLHRLQANTVKVDRSFVSRMGVDAKGSEMVRAIVALALNLGMDVVAEGVENVEQMVALQTLGCAHAQGFYFSRPVDLLAADRLIASQPWREEARRAVLDPEFQSRQRPPQSSTRGRTSVSPHRSRRKDRFRKLLRGGW